MTIKTKRGASTVSFPPMFEPTDPAVTAAAIEQAVQAKRSADAAVLSAEESVKSSAAAQMSARASIFAAFVSFAALIVAIAAFFKSP
ncbi:hypothetical protein [Janthinobacterium sp. 78]|uniref:hypothetical protein n=1 Tax=Janthinobacterium sp. 78 TaxID=2135631 RepID=UPI001402ADF9|nr:hypothetical protein [Janthinobacterium sp. 78]